MLACNLKGSVHYHHGRKHGGVQALMGPEKGLSIIYLDLKAVRKRLSSSGSQEEGVSSAWAELEH